MDPDGGWHSCQAKLYYGVCKVNFERVEKVGNLGNDLLFLMLPSAWPGG